MDVATPELHLRTCFVLNDHGRIVATREPVERRGPLFILARGSRSCAWGIHADVPAGIAGKLDRLARSEPVAIDFRDPPVHARRYLEALAVQGGSVRSTGESDGPAFTFPHSQREPDDVAVVADEPLLERHFRGWTHGEIEAGRGPVLAVLENDWPVSVCFCARRSNSAAEAGVETAEGYRRRGYGAKVTGAWARRIRATGRIPLYSTLWSNEASLGVARKLGLVPYAGLWSIERRP